MAWEQDESQPQLTARADGLPERKRRSDGTLTTADEHTGAQRSREKLAQEDTENAKRAFVDSNATTLSVVALQQIEEALHAATRNAPEQKSFETAIADPVGEVEEQAEEEDGNEGTGVDAVSFAGRRVALDLPRASAAAGRARPSLLLRMPYSALLKVSQQLPRSARVSLCVTCRELCRLLGRGPGGRWDAEAAVPTLRDINAKLPIITVCHSQNQ